jgi:hypothetical protein
MSKHARPDEWQYITDFPKDRAPVLVYPANLYSPTLIIRWVPEIVEDKYFGPQVQSVEYVLDGDENNIHPLIQY